MLLLLACADPPNERPEPEPLVLPDDPSENGVPVGVQTLVAGDVTFEVWYPASGATTGATESPDFDQFLPAAFTEHVGDVSFPTFDSGAVRDAPLREPETPYPVVVFSHGFGGMRLQSIDYAVHLASRGYVVLSADHPGRTMGDVLPCLFSPALDGCDLSGFAGDDPAVAHVAALLDWVEAPDAPFDGAIDPSRIGVSGHSAGAGTTVAVGDADARVTALLPMAGYGAPGRDVPTLLMGGTCDAFARDSDAVAALEQVRDGALVRVLGAGHLAFSDLCALDLAGLADSWLADRDDLNPTFYALLLQLASDGCPGAVPDPEACDASGFLDLAVSAPIVRHYSTVFFDAELRGEGDGVTADVYPEAELRTP